MSLEINMTLLVQIGIVLLLFILLDRIFFQPMIKLINNRKERVESVSSKVSSKKKEVADLVGKYEESVKATEESANIKKEEIKAEGIKMEKEILEKTQREHDDAVKEARLDAEKELEKVEASSEIKNISVEIAEKILQRRI